MTGPLLRLERYLSLSWEVYHSPEAVHLTMGKSMLLPWPLRLELCGERSGTKPGRDGGSASLQILGLIKPRDPALPPLH